MKKKGEFDQIEQNIFSAKTESEKEKWRKVLKRLQDNPPPKPIKKTR